MLEVQRQLLAVDVHRARAAQRDVELLLAGERGEYELIAGKGDAGARLKAIAGSANDGMMLPEQVWDDQPPPGETSGKGTRSGTPLAWTHAAFVRLAWSIDAGRPVETPSIVACRYTKTDCG